MKRKTIVIICALIAIVLLFGLAGSTDSGDHAQNEEKLENEYGFNGFEGVYKSKDGNSGLWVDASGYGVLLDRGETYESHLVPVSSDSLSFKVGGVLVTFNADKDIVAFGGFGGTVLYRDTSF